MTSAGLARYTKDMSEHEAVGFRQMIRHFGYSTERALVAIGRTDLLRKDHHSRTAAKGTAKLRAVAGGGATDGARGLSSSLVARPDEIQTPAGTSGNLPVGLGAEAPLPPPFWLAELRKANDANGN